jgi:hypothetical protein
MNTSNIQHVPNLRAMAESGKRIYREKYQCDFETRFPGQIVAIEVDSQRAFVAPSVMKALQLGRSVCPRSLFYFMRVGAPAVYRMR